MQQSVFRSVNARLLTAAALVVLGMALLGLFGSKMSYAAVKVIDVYVNEEQIEFTIDPDVKAGTTVVQMRPLFEALGMEVTWNSEQRSISAVKEGATLLLTLDSQEAIVNGRSMKLDRPAVAVKGHTLVPLRFVSESTGSLVHWNSVHREIIVFTPEYVASFELTMDEVKAYLDDLQRQVDEEYAASKASEAVDSAVVLPPAADDKAAPVRLDQLQGMYYGAQFDYGGYECGGTCWLFYTFLPDQKIVVGQPEGGGPETIDCKKDACLSYSIKDGMLTIKGEEPLPISVNKDGALVIDEVTLRKVVPVPEGTKLGGEYISQGYMGLVGITPYSTSWTNYLTFNANGTFESDESSLASLDTVVARTDSTSVSDTVRGTYKISGNTIVLTYEDGTIERYVFAVPPARDDGRIYVQIGDQRFHLNNGK